MKKKISNLKSLIKEDTKIFFLCFCDKFIRYAGDFFKWVKMVCKQKEMIRQSQGAFTLVELLVVILIMSFMLGGTFVIFSAGQSTWFTTDANIRLQESLRQALERITVELRQTEVSHQQIIDAAGPGTTDVIQFSLPIICEAGNSLIDINGDVAYWGAPLRWGCTDSTCMDADDDCTTLDYSLVEYRLDNDNQLIRRVLNSLGSTVREDIFAQNVSDFQARLSGEVITLDVSVEAITVNKRLLTAQTSADVYLRN